MKNIKLLNPVSGVWRNVISENEYNLSAEAENPDAIIVRSAEMHGYEPEPNVWAVARAGVGVNNIPLDEYAEKGIVVFNTPGANANAVKELVLSGLLLASRDIAGGMDWAQSLKGTPDIEKQVEKGKKAFVGPEIQGKTLGVIGLGAVGLLVANAGAALGMNVLGYDPFISVDNAWKLSRAVKPAKNQEEVIENADYLTIHVPLLDSTRGTFNESVFKRMKKGAALLNFARGELVNNEDVKAALENGTLRRYVCDFPTEALLGVKNVVCLPHLGASTPESEDNCVEMVAAELNAFLKTGSISHGVNFPDGDFGMPEGWRILVLHKNVPNMVSSITARISARNINIGNMANKSRGAHAVTVLDLDNEPSKETLEEIRAIADVYAVREFENPRVMM